MSEVGSSVERTGTESAEMKSDGMMNNSETQSQPLEATPSKRSKRKLIAFIGAGVLLVAAGTAGAVAINHSNNVKAYDAAVAESNAAAQQILDAEADYPQAAYLLVEHVDGAAKKDSGEFKSISVVPEALISKKTNAPLVEWLTPLEGQPGDLGKLLEQHAGQVFELHAEVTKTLKDEKADLQPELADQLKDSTRGAVVNGESVKKMQAQAAKRSSQARAAQAAVDELDGYLGGIDYSTVTGAKKYLTAPAAEALKNKDAYAKPFTKATQQAKDEYAKRATALQVAVDAFTGKTPAKADAVKPAKAEEKPAAASKTVEVKVESANPTAADRLHFKHTPKKSKPTLEASADLRSTLAAFVASATALKTTHDKTVADEAAAAAAAEQAAAAAASGGGGYTDPGTGNWVPSGGGNGSGGGGWTPPAGGGGGGNGSGGGGDGGYVPPPSTGCPAPPAGWFPSGGTANGCPTYLPPGGGDTEGW